MESCGIEKISVAPLKVGRRGARILAPKLAAKKEAAMPLHDNVSWEVRIYV